MNEPTEITLRGRVPLAARRFNAGAAHRAIGLHGWLDNANSLALLAKALPEIEIVALDFAGHGRSGHLPEGGWYHFIDYLDDIAAAYSNLGWDRALLLGHSLGGAAATAFAAAAPERVDRLLLIEALGPLAGLPENAVKALRQGLQERSRVGEKQKRLFSNRNEAIEARLQATPMRRESVEMLLERGLVAVEGDLTWASDPRLMIVSPVRIQEPVIQHWIRAIEAPTLVIVGDQPPPYFTPDIRRGRQDLLQRGQRIELPGQHHLHLDTPAPVAQAIRGFLNLPK